MSIERSITVCFWKSDRYKCYYSGKYITISVNKKSVEEARNYFARVGAELITHFGRLGSKCIELEPDERLRIFHDFYRTGEETDFYFDIKETRKRDMISRILYVLTQWR